MSDKPARSVTLPTRLLYGTGSVADGVKNTTFNTFLLFFYTQVVGLSGSMAGAAIFIALLIDAVTDPLLGSISDNARSRWGRRHPFIYASALPMALCFIGLFNPPRGGQSDQPVPVDAGIHRWRSGIHDVVFRTELGAGRRNDARVRRAYFAGQLQGSVRLDWRHCHTAGWLSGVLRAVR